MSNESDSADALTSPSPAAVSETLALVPPARPMLDYLFVLAVLPGQLRNLPLCCPFRVSWWAVSFPLAACSIAALRFAAARPGVISDTIALALLALARLVIAALLGRTLFGIGKGELRTLST